MARRYWAILCLTVLVSSMVLSACGDDDSSGSSNAADLNGTEWKLAAIGSDTIPDDISATIAFNTDKSINGTGGCNNFSGTWAGEGDDLTITTGPMTMMACEDPVMLVESGFIKVLADTRSFDLEDETLELHDANGETLATLKPLVRSKLTDGTWNATGVNNGNGGVASLVADTEITAIFSAEGAISGNSGCNTYGGDYTVDGSTIAISQLISTMMACDDPIMEQERAYLTALGNATTIELGEKTLQLRSADGALQASFELATD